MTLLEHRDLNTVGTEYSNIVLIQGDSKMAYMKMMEVLKWKLINSLDNTDSLRKWINFIKPEVGNRIDEKTPKQGKSGNQKIGV